MSSFHTCPTHRLEKDLVHPQTLETGLACPKCFLNLKIETSAIRLNRHTRQFFLKWNKKYMEILKDFESDVEMKGSACFLTIEIKPQCPKSFLNAMSDTEIVRQLRAELRSRIELVKSNNDFVERSSLYALIIPEFLKDLYFMIHEDARNNFTVICMSIVRRLQASYPDKKIYLHTTFKLAARQEAYLNSLRNQMVRPCRSLIMFDQNLLSQNKSAYLEPISTYSNRLQMSKSALYTGNSVDSAHRYARHQAQSSLRPKNPNSNSVQNFQNRSNLTVNSAAQNDIQTLMVKSDLGFDEEESSQLARNKTYVIKISTLEAELRKEQAAHQQTQKTMNERITRIQDEKKAIITECERLSINIAEERNELMSNIERSERVIEQNEMLNKQIIRIIHEKNQLAEDTNKLRAEIKRFQEDNQKLITLSQKLKESCSDCIRLKYELQCKTAENLALQEVRTNLQNVIFGLRAETPTRANSEYEQQNSLTTNQIDHQSVNPSDSNGAGSHQIIAHSRDDSTIHASSVTVSCRDTAKDLQSRPTVKEIALQQEITKLKTICSDQEENLRIREETEKNLRLEREALEGDLKSARIKLNQLTENGSQIGLDSMQNSSSKSEGEHRINGSNFIVSTRVFGEEQEDKERASRGSGQKTVTFIKTSKQIEPLVNCHDSGVKKQYEGRSIIMDAMNSEAEIVRSKLEQTFSHDISALLEKIPSDEKDLVKRVELLVDLQNYIKQQLPGTGSAKEKVQSLFLNSTNGGSSTLSLQNDFNRMKEDIEIVNYGSNEPASQIPSEQYDMNSILMTEAPPPPQMTAKEYDLTNLNSVLQEDIRILQENLEYIKNESNLEKEQLYRENGRLAKDLHQVSNKLRSIERTAIERNNKKSESNKIAKQFSVQVNNSNKGEKSQEEILKNGHGNDEITLLKLKLSENEAKLDKATKTINETNGLIQQHASKDQQKSKEVKELKQTINSKDKQLQIRWGQINLLKDNLSKRQSELEGESKKVLKLKEQITQKDEEIKIKTQEASKLKFTLEQKDEDIKGKSKQLEVLKQSLGQKDGQVKGNNAEVTQLKLELVNKDQQIKANIAETTQLRDSLNHKQSQIKRSRTEVTKLEQTLSQKDDEIKAKINEATQLKNTLAQKETQLLSSSQSQGVKSNQLQELRLTVTQKDKQLSQLRNLLSAAQKKTEQTTIMLQQKQTIQGSTNDFIKSQEERLKRLAARLQQEQSLLDAKMDQLIEIESNLTLKEEELNENMLSNTENENWQAKQFQKLQERVKSVNQVEAIIISSQKQIAESKKQIQVKSNEQINQLQESLKGLSKKLAQAQKGMSEQSQKIKQQQQKLAKQEEKLTKKQQQFESLQNKYKQESELQSVENKNRFGALEKQLTVLKSQNKELEQVVKKTSSEKIDTSHFISKEQYDNLLNECVETRASLENQSETLQNLKGWSERVVVLITNLRNGKGTNMDKVLNDFEDQVINLQELLEE